MSNKTTKEYWEKVYEPAEPTIAPEGDRVRQWLEIKIPTLSPGSQKSCIEIGCYPGQYLSIFGQFGYELYGIDFCRQIGKLDGYLRESGYHVGKIWEEDFFNFNPPKKFDLVASFGFIEHFTNYREVIEKHIRFLNDQGYLILETPNFLGGFQNWFHRSFDRQNFDRHHIPAMDINDWIDTIESNGLKIIEAGYFGNYHYWCEHDRRSRLEKFHFKAFKTLVDPIFKKVFTKDNPFYSPFAGVIAQKQ